MCHKPMPIMTETEIKKFQLYIKKEDKCWFWTHSTNRLGYGFFFLRCNTYLAHRVAFFLHNALDPAEHDVLHTCDTPTCVNPDHLFLGTHLDNMTDMIVKGRDKHEFGEARSSSKLTDDIIRDLRSRLLFWGCVTTWAKEFSVNKTTISKALRKQKWKHIN